MALQTTGYTNDTAKHLLLDAGAIYKNMNTETWEGALISATQGGMEFNAIPEFYNIEVDGVKSENVKGLKRISGWTVDLGGSLLEITEENLKAALAGAMVDTSTSTEYNIITAKNDVELSDYIDNVAFVGRLAENQKPVIIIIENVMNTEGIKLKTEDKKGAVLPVKFTGHYDAENLDKPPFKIFYPKAPVQ